MFSQQSARSDCVSTADDDDSPDSHLFRTTSTYRCALRKSMQEEQKAWAQQSSSSSGRYSTTGTQFHLARGASRFDDIRSNSAKDPYDSGSVYSTDEPEFAAAQGTYGDGLADSAKDLGYYTESVYSTDEPESATA